MIRLVDGNWRGELADARRSHPGELLVVSPFIKVGALKLLLGRAPGAVRAITRFSLGDFASGASDIAALETLLAANARVRGIRNLHSKLYVFGTSRAIMTSANLTNAALGGNHELGFVTENDEIVRTCRDYFESLWGRAGKNCTPDQVFRWEEQVARHLQSAHGLVGSGGLEDFGADAGIAEPLDPQKMPAELDSIQAFVKFFGRASKRSPLTRLVSDVVEFEGCHRVASYPATRRPSGVRESAVLFLGHLTADPVDRWGPNDIRVFGKAIAMKHVPGRDEATPEDKERRPWKANWSNYIRLHHPEFVMGTLANAVSVNELMDAEAGLGTNAFATTQRNARRGSGNTDPRMAYRRQPAVELSVEGRAWLEIKLEEAFAFHGKIPVGELRNLDWPEIPSRRRPA